MSVVKVLKTAKTIRSLWINQTPRWCLRVKSYILHPNKNYQTTFDEREETMKATFQHSGTVPFIVFHNLF